MFIKTSYNINRFENLYNDITYNNFIIEIISNKEEMEYLNKYIGRVIKIDNNSKYRNTKLIIYTNKKTNYEYGDIVKLEGQFSYAKNAKNYKGFNYQRSLWQNKIYGILKSEKEVKIANKKSLESKLNELKLKLEKNIEISIENNEYQSFLKGILLGNTTNFSEEMKENFRDASLSHVLAISGMHISYIIIILERILKFINNRKIKRLLSIIIIFLFVVMIGKTPSSIRALVMFFMIVIAELLYRKSNTLVNWCVSLIIIFLINPMYIENLGVWLSFGGTLGIISIYSKCKFELKNKILNYIFQNFILSICVQLCIFPIVLYNFNTISLTFFISNIAVSFLIAPIMSLGFAICIFGNFFICGKFFSVIEILLIKIIFYSAKFVSNLFLSKIYFKTPNFIILFLYYIFLYLIVTKKDFTLKKIKKYFKKIIYIILIILILLNSVKIFNKELQIYFLDVGQGDCTLIKTESNKIILIDGGEGNSDKYDQGKNVVLPYLLDRGITKIDYIMISHFDSDHCGGLFYIIENLKVKNIIIGLQSEKYLQYENLLKIIKKRNINLIIVQNGMKIKIDNTSYFDILWPDGKYMITENSINNNSIVAKFCYKNKTVLFTGDIEYPAENVLVKLHGRKLKSDILKSPHHGSSTSSTEDFLKFVKPRIVLIGVGEDNSYGHPSNVVIDMYNNIGAVIYRTDIMGEIMIKIKRKKFVIDKYIK